MLKEKLHRALGKGIDAGHITDVQRENVVKAMDSRLNPTPLHVAAWAFIPANRAKIERDDLTQVRKFLEDNAPLYQTPPSILMNEMRLYGTRDTESIYAEGTGDLWDQRGNPVAGPRQFWRMAKWLDPTSSLAIVGEQLCGLLAHSADLERDHSTLSFLQNKYRNSLSTANLRGSYFVNQALRCKRKAAALARLQKASHRQTLALRAAADFRRGFPLDAEDEEATSSSESESASGSSSSASSQSDESDDASVHADAE